MHILPTAIRKLLRHTGARYLVRSGAIGYNGTVPGNLAEVLFKLSTEDSNGIRQFLIRLRPGLRVSDINKCELFTTIHAFAHFVDRDSGDFHTTSLRVYCSQPILE